MIIDFFSFSCPLILCSFAALFSELAGSLALFLEGLVTFSAFLFYAFTMGTGLPVIAFVLTILTSTLVIFLFAALIEKFHAHKFITGTAINLLFSSLTTCFSSILFGTRGVLSSQEFHFDLLPAKLFTMIITLILITAAVLFLLKTRTGLYLRITGSDSDVLIAKGVNPSATRILSWTIAGLFSSIAGILLTMRISSFVPNISSGRGWMALAAIFLGRKRPVRMIIAVLVFCAADYFGVHIQNIFPMLPTSIILSLPYMVALLITLIPEIK